MGKENSTSLGTSTRTKSAKVASAHIGGFLGPSRDIFFLIAMSDADRNKKETQGTNLSKYTKSIGALAVTSRPPSTIDDAGNDKMDIPEGSFT